MTDIHRMAVEKFDSRRLLEHAAKQRDQGNYKDFLIVDVDCHHYESESLREIVQYIEDPVLRHTAMVESVTKSFLPGVIGFQDLAGRITRYPLRKLEETPADSRHRDVHLTLRWMDAMGVDYVCLFPTPMLLLGLHPMPEIETNMARAYNRWLVEKILYHEPRIKSMLYLPFNDPEATYKVVKDFGDKKGVVGFLVTTARYKPIYDNAYMKTYSLLEELGKPIGFHASYNWSDQLMSNTNRFIVMHALGFTLFNAISCANWVVNALPERFPKLKVIWIESGVAWVPWLMQRLDNDYKMRTSECPSLKKLPSEYMREMYYTTQPLEVPDDMSVLEATFKMVNAESQLLWSSDYPHWDMDLPSKIFNLPCLSRQAKLNILGENARRVFNLDVSERFPRSRPANKEVGG